MNWYMQELVDEGDQPPKWRDRQTEGEQGYVFRENYRGGDPTLKRSLELKVMKALQSKQRIQGEEALMLAEARRRHSATPGPDPWRRNWPHLPDLTEMKSPSSSPKCHISK